MYKNAHKTLSRVVDSLQGLIDTVFQEFDLSVGREKKSGL